MQDLEETLTAIAAGGDEHDAADDAKLLPNALSYSPAPRRTATLRRPPYRW